MRICLDMRTGAGCGTENPNHARHCSACDKPLRFALTLKDPRTLVGHYRIVRVIGYGGYGAVYEGHKHDEPTHSVALKETFDASSISSFAREFRVLSGLDHANLPRYIDMFEAQGNGYLVMEYVAGQSLQDILDEQKELLPESQVLGYALQLCDVLEYLHSQQPPILHRDIKPANIRLTPEGRIKLVDFGLLKQAGYQTRATIRGLGTPAYAPLEQYGDNQQVTDVRSDIYSLGATLYHLFSGQEPPSAPNRLTGERDPLPPLPPEVSSHVKETVMKAMSLMRGERFASISQFRQALVGVQLVEPEVAEAEQPSLTHSPETKEVEIPQVPSYNPFKLDNLDKQKTIIRILRANPQNARVWLILGWMMDKQGKRERASECYERALKINLRAYEAGQLTAETLPTWVDLVTSKKEVALISSDLYPSASRSSVRMEKNDHTILPSWFDQEENGPSFFSRLKEFYPILFLDYIIPLFFPKFLEKTLLGYILLPLQLIIFCFLFFMSIMYPFVTWFFILILLGKYDVLFFMATLVFIVIFSNFYLLKSIQQIVSSRHWPASEAIVIGSFAISSTSKGKQKYRLRVVCAYPVDKQIFYSTVPSKNTYTGPVYQSGRHSSDDELEEKEKEYSFAKPMTVFYNPLQPDIVLHKVGLNMIFYVYLLLIAMLIRFMYSIIFALVNNL